MISNEQIIRIIEESKRYCFSYLGYPFDHLMLTPIAMLDFKIVKTISLRGMLSNIFGTYDLMDLKKAFKEHKIVFASTVARKDVILRMEVSFFTKNKKICIISPDFVQSSFRCTAFHEKLSWVQIFSIFYRIRLPIYEFIQIAGSCIF